VREENGDHVMFEGQDGRAELSIFDCDCWVAIGGVELTGICWLFRERVCVCLEARLKQPGVGGPATAS